MVWEEFVIHKKDEEIGDACFSASRRALTFMRIPSTTRLQKGRQINRSEAMSLAKVRKEANHSSWEEFDAQFVPDESAAIPSHLMIPSLQPLQRKSVTRKTAAEKEKRRRRRRQQRRREGREEG